MAEDKTRTQKAALYAQKLIKSGLKASKKPLGNSAQKKDTKTTQRPPYRGIFK